ncbi:MAG TPA: hypothetical protein VJX67_14805 [Blastocatellia bacterium]|nr:hypothetical protein [Blastocatellia bacterium]
MKLIGHLLIHICVLILTIRLMGLVKRVDPPVPAAPQQAHQVERRGAPSVPSAETLPPTKTGNTLKLPDGPDFGLPYNLADVINSVDKEADTFCDLTGIWVRLGIDRDTEGIFDGIDPPHSGSWTAQVLRADKPNEGRLVVVFISVAQGAWRRYVVFKWGGTRWRISNIDILDDRYAGSPHQRYHRLVTDGHHTWLALRALRVTGTGVYETDEDWYEISGDHPRKVLEFPTKGWFANDDEDVCNREFGSRIIREKALTSSYAIQVRFWVTFGLTKEDWKFHQTRDATYVWNNWERQFVLGESSSNVSQEEIADVFHTGMLSDSKLLIYNLSELTRVRERGSQRDRKGLESLFSRMRNRE